MFIESDFRQWQHPQRGHRLLLSLIRTEDLLLYTKSQESRFRGSSTLRILQIRNIHCERSTTGLAGRKTSQELWRVRAVWRHRFHLIPICQHHLVFRRCLLFQLRSKIYPLLSIYRLGVNNPSWAILLLSEISIIIPLVAAAPCI